ncbi:MAG: aspartate ammonia-lyase [Candidatus Omnitrophota bacterium]
MGIRREHDMLGDKDVPEDVYWGIHTARAIENFPLVSGRVAGVLIRAMALVKKACAQANCDLGYLVSEKAAPIIAACDDVAAGKLADEFPLDALQGGAGTSTNMNLNEVIANRALELMGKGRGDYAALHPLDDVNCHQSTNDVYPTAVKVAGIFELRRLSEAIALLQGGLQRKEKEFAGIVTLGRTEMQEAVPMTLGAQFAGFAEAFGRDRWRVFKCEERLRVVNLGGTVIGTGMGAPREYIFLVIEKLREVTGLGVSRGENPVGETMNGDVFVEVSGILKAHAVNILKMTGDLRLLNMLGEIKLPAVQAGSSMMPGKVNPVILEAAAQAALKVCANDMLVAEAAGRATGQIVEFMPLLADAFLGSLALLNNAVQQLTVHIDGIQADEIRCRYYLDHSRMIITAFVPTFGYDRCNGLLKEFDGAGEKNLRLFLEGKLGKACVDKALSPHQLLGLGYRT